MCSKPSTTIGFERRFNPTLQLTTVEEFIADSAWISAPKPPNLARIVEINRGPFVGAPPLVQELAAPPDEAQLLDVRPVAGPPRRSPPGRDQRSRLRSSFSTKAGFVLDADSPCASSPDPSTRRNARSAGSTRSRCFDVAGFVLGGGDERDRAASRSTRSRQLMAAGAEVIDVREKDERDTGYIPGSRNVPYRLMGSVLSRPRAWIGRCVTICESGTRAAIAASILRAPRVRRASRRRAAA